MHLVQLNLARVFETLAAYWALPQAAAEVTLPLIPSEEHLVTQSIPTLTS